MATPISPLPQPADAELFLGVPPDGVPRRLLGRVTWVWRDVRRVFDEGHLTDSQGRKVDFRNCMIILTSNLGAQSLAALPEVCPLFSCCILKS